MTTNWARKINTKVPNNQIDMICGLIPSFFDLSNIKQSETEIIETLKERYGLPLFNTDITKALHIDDDLLVDGKTYTPLMTCSINNNKIRIYEDSQVTINNHLFILN